MATHALIYTAAELAFLDLQEELIKQEVRVSVGLLSEEQALEVEFRRSRLDWKWWFREGQHDVENCFSLSLTSPGKPPVVVGVAVYSYDIEIKQVSIHMLEHFRQAYPNSGVEKRMAWIAFYAAYAFAMIVNAESFRICHPIEDVIPYYQYWGFKYDGNHMTIERSRFLSRLTEVSDNAGFHAYEW